MNRGEDTAEILSVRYINLGVEKYESGHIEEAVLAFSDALSVAKFIDEENPKRPQHQTRGVVDPELGCAQKMTPATNDISIFLNPIKLPLRFPGAKRCATLSLIAMFNLAICYHCNAITQNMDRIYLRKALQHYELAYAIQMQEGVDMTLTPTMIIMSNVGHIHRILGNNDDSIQCFQHLLSTLMFLVEAGEKEMVWEFDGFFENVLNTVYANSPAAAA